MNISVSTSTTAELEKNFKALARQVTVAYASKALFDVLLRALAPFVVLARRRARRARVSRVRYKGENRPVDPQHMADSIEARRDRRRTFNNKGDLVVYAGPGARHWWGSKIEFGTRYHRAWPFMRSAWAQTAPGMLERIAVDFGDYFNRAVSQIALTQSRSGGGARRARS